VNPILNQTNQITPLYPIPLRSILILSSHLRLVLPSVSFRQCFRPTFFMYSSSLPCVLHATPISSSLIWIFCIRIFYFSDMREETFDTGCPKILKHNVTQQHQDIFHKNGNIPKHFILNRCCFSASP